MNKEYTYINGKIVVRDDQGRNTEREYTDNLDQILVQENLIETIETEIQKLEKENDRNKKNSKKRYRPSLTPLAVSLAYLIGIPSLSFILDDPEALTRTMEGIFGTINEVAAFTVTMIIGCVFAGAAAEYFTYRNYKKAVNDARGVESQLEYLRKRLVKEKEVLEELNRQKSRENENTEFRTVTVNDIEALKKLRNYKTFTTI